MTYKLAIIGYGKIAKDQHVPAIRGSHAFELAAVVSGHAKSVEGVDRLYATEEAFFEAAADIGCVSVCGPPETRYATVCKAIAAGKSVLMEKPPAATLAEARDLADLATDKGVTLFASWHARANAAVEEAERRLKGARVASLEITWKEDVRKWHPGQTWLWEPGGFGVFDPGINALSIATAILPSPLFVRSARLSTPAGRQTPIAAELAFSDRDGATDLKAVFDWRQTGAQTWDITVRTEDGSTLLLSEGGAKLAVDGKEISATTGDVEYPRLYARFAELLDRRESDVDLRPLELVADAFLRGERLDVEAFAD